MRNEYKLTYLGPKRRCHCLGLFHAHCGSCPSCGAVVAAVGPVAVGVREVVVVRGGGGRRRRRVWWWWWLRMMSWHC
jgi:hypothetical protein